MRSLMGVTPIRWEKRTCSSTEDDVTFILSGIFLVAALIDSLQGDSSSAANSVACLAMRPAGQPSLDGRGAGDDDVRSVFDVAYDAMSARCSRCSSHRYWSVPAD